MDGGGRSRMRLFVLVRAEDVSGVSGRAWWPRGGVHGRDGGNALAAASVQRGVLRVNPRCRCGARPRRADAGEVAG